MAAPELAQAFVHIYKKVNTTRSIHGLRLAIAQVANEAAKVLVINPLAQGVQTIAGVLAVISLRLTGQDPNVTDFTGTPSTSDLGRLVYVNQDTGLPDELWIGMKSGDGTRVWKQIL